jgi:Flp pilus assembly protein TadD
MMRRELQFGRCLEIDASNFEAKYQLGLLSKAQGDTAAAIRLLEEVTASVPNDPLVLRDLGTLYLQVGDGSQSEKCSRTLYCS